MGLQGAHKGGAVTAELLPDDPLHAVVDNVGGDVEFLFLELLKDKGTVDEIVDRIAAHLLDFLLQFFATIDLGGRFFTSGHQFAHLRKRHDIGVHHGGNTVDDLLGRFQVY